MTKCTTYMTHLKPALRWLLGLWMLLGGARLSAQIVDENTPFLAPFPSVGASGAYDLFAQSFTANIARVYRIGAWLRADSGGGEVQLSLLGSNTSGQPDTNQILHQSALIAPTTTGGWVYDTGFVAVLTPGLVYWLAVDGYNTVTGTGYSSVGVSNVFTDTNQPIFGSTDGGGNWAAALNSPMAVFVEGDTCNFNISLNQTEFTLCPDDTVRVSAPGGYPGYLWSTGATTNAIDVVASGIYTVTVVNNDFCRSAAEAEVRDVSAPIINLPAIVNACEGETQGLSVFPLFTSYLWSTGQTNEAITVDTSGLYWIEVTSFFGCVGRDSSFVIFHPTPSLSLGNDTTLCDGQFIQLDAGPGYAAYQWSNGSTGRSIFVDATGDYAVEVTSGDDCTGISNTVDVQVFPNPATPTIAQTLSGLSGSFGFTYTWVRDGDTLPITTQTITEPAAGTYSLTVTNGFGCPATSAPFVVTAVQPGSFVSEGFSPNGDGLNEVFFVEGIENYPDNLLVVFNRWGEEVFRRANYSNDWHGLGPNGKPLPAGNYFYVLELGALLPTREGAVLIQR
jgi:gliding motility-associated-like protein